MTLQEIQERNKQIALMLDWKYVEDGDVWNPNMTHDYSFVRSYEMKFHSDWNWLMKAVEFIENIEVDEFGYIVEMLPGMSRIYLSRNNYTILSTEPKSSRKEATFTAVSDFAKLYNEKKL